MWNVFWAINKLLYSVLGPNMSTAISQSWFGKWVLRLLKGRSTTLREYTGSEGIKLHLLPSEAEYFGFFHMGAMNLYETNVIKRVLHPGDSFIDVGAYVDGWHSIVASKAVGRTCHVYTFEPIPAFFRRLMDNVKLNHLTNVTLEMVAVSAKNGSRTFYENKASSSFYEKHAGQNKAGGMTVKTVTLDSYVTRKRIKSLRLVKIDAEGAELEVLKGGIKTLSSPNAPDLMIEIDDRYLKSGGTSEGEVFSLLRNLGYRAYSIGEGGLSAYKTKADGRQLFNVYFSKRRQL